MQDLDEYLIPTHMCQLKRAKKFSVCGAADHHTSLYDRSFAYRKTTVAVNKCRKIHRDQYIWSKEQEQIFNSMKTCL